jgi:hypothetical protein
MSKLGICIPTIRPEQFQKWFVAWEDLFNKHDATVYVTFDMDSIPKMNLPDWVNAYCWKDYGDLNKCINHHTGSCRSFSLYKAYQDECTWVICLDDDCLPPKDGSDPIASYEFEFGESLPFTAYHDIGNLNTNSSQYVRGYPEKYKGYTHPIVIQYGGWDNVLDFDAKTQAQLQLNKQPIDGFHFRGSHALKKYEAVTCCMMNVAIKREYIPTAYQLLMGLEQEGLDRFDDIWSGLFMKRICDERGDVMTINGGARVWHERASSASTNLDREVLGMAPNEDLWDELVKVNFFSEGGESPLSLYKNLCDRLDVEWFGRVSYGKRLTQAMRVWTEMF